MIKKIGDWVFGSFFRTIGRLLVFVLLGVIISRLIDFGSLIDNFRITDLFLEKVDALTITESVKNSGSGYFSIENANNYLPYNDFYYTTVQSGWIDRAIYFNFSPRIYTGNDDYIEFPFIASMPSQTEINYPVQDDFVTCRTWTCESYNNSGNCSQFKCLNWYTSGTSTVNDHLMTDYEVNSLSFYARIEFADYDGNWAGWLSCSIQGNSFICPLVHDLYIKFIQIIINYNPPKSSQWYFGLQRGYNLYRGQDIQNAVEQNTQAINNQSQQQQQQHNETMQQSQQQHEEIMDINMTETNETATGFFNSFNDSDIGGLSGIITAPLVMINKMLDGVCVQPSATWKGATISLPCGDMLWSRSGASDLKNLINVFYGGLICYYAIVQLWRMIEGLKDPTQDKVEVTDL